MSSDLKSSPVYVFPKGMLSSRGIPKSFQTAAVRIKTARSIVTSTHKATVEPKKSAEKLIALACYPYTSQYLQNAKDGDLSSLLNGDTFMGCESAEKAELSVLQTSEFRCEDFDMTNLSNNETLTSKLLADSECKTMRKKKRSIKDVSVTADEETLKKKMRVEHNTLKPRSNITDLRKSSLYYSTLTSRFSGVRTEIPNVSLRQGDQVVVSSDHASVGSPSVILRKGWRGVLKRLVKKGKKTFWEVSWTSSDAIARHFDSFTESFIGKPKRKNNWRGLIPQSSYLEKWDRDEFRRRMRVNQTLFKTRHSAMMRMGNPEYRRIMSEYHLNYIWFNDNQQAKKYLIQRYHLLERIANS
jgi:hypothetical protein